MPLFCPGAYLYCVQTTDSARKAGLSNVYKQQKGVTYAKEIPIQYY